MEGEQPAGVFVAEAVYGQREVFRCDRCFAMTQGAPPHGWGEPCPQTIASDEAYVAMLDAQRMAYIRQANPMIAPEAEEEP